MKLIILYFLCVLSLFANNLRESKIKENIQSRFLQHYPTMHMQSIDIQPTSTSTNKLNDYHVKNVIITKDDLRRAKGSVMVTLANGSKIRKRYFKYHIHATIDVYTATQNIQKETILTPQIASLQTIPFTTLYHHPVDAHFFYAYCAKRHIKDGAVLSAEKLKKNSAVNRNDHVSAVIRDGGLALNFTATAMQSGNVGDIIKIRKDYKKQFKARIISKSNVEILP